MDLFSKDTPRGGTDGQTPLAYRMSPRTLDEYIGQEHIIGEGRLLRRVIQADRLSSIIFYGPPGTGKTSLARVIANTTKSAFTTLNAVLTGVKDLREQIEKAKERRDLYEKRTILFVDEVHRWNKAQQDALLPWVERGTVILIGATTHNPYFEVNSALVSRSRIFQLVPLSSEELKAVARQAIEDPLRGYGAYSVEFEEGALEHLIRVASGDARSLLNAVELAIETSPESFPPPQDTPGGETIRVSFEAAEESIQRKAVLYDKEGDYHFDVISAFIKSIRGGDPDAVLYWLAKMVHAGEDPRFIFRRMLISAGEDIGMADPHALSVVEAAASAFDRVGMPEGRYHLAHAALYLANAPKSNSSLGFFDALEAVKSEDEDQVPRHLKDAARDSKSFGHGEGYLYPHAYRAHWVAQQYLPSGLQGKVFYRPSDVGFEASIREEVDRKREANLAAMIGEETPEVLTYSPPDEKREQWLARTADNRSSALLTLRDEVFRLLAPARHHRILDIKADDGLFLWEALRRAPEGSVTGIVENEENKEYLQRYASALNVLDQPRIYTAPAETLDEKSAKETYEGIVAKNGVTRISDKEPFFRFLYHSLNDGGTAVLAQAVPRKSPRLSELSRASEMSSDLKRILEEAEELLYSRKEHTKNPVLAWDGEDLGTWARAAGFSNTETRSLHVEERRRILKKHIEKWLSPSGGNYIQSLGDAIKIDRREEVKHELIRLLGACDVDWYTEYCILIMRK